MAGEGATGRDLGNNKDVLRTEKEVRVQSGNPRPSRDATRDVGGGRRDRRAETLPRH